jgi:LPPG:FO 2-phospho-L-lactate transferase
VSYGAVRRTGIPPWSRSSLGGYRFPLRRPGRRPTTNYTRAMKVTALAGGVGGAKLLVGLQRVVPSGDLSAVINTADDASIYGVAVSPDVDIVTYWLAGVADRDRGWGLAGDTFTVVDALERLGAEPWFRLGDRDLATCLWRTVRMQEGAPLSRVTDEVRVALGVPTRLLPMSDDPVRTIVESTDGRTLAFQEYFVREATRPEVSALRYEGADRALPAPGVLESLATADLVVVCPSNPYLSIAPILALRGLREVLRAHPRTVAVTPIVAGSALKGPADRLLTSLGAGATASGVAALYADFCTTFVCDVRDATEIPKVESLGMASVGLDTVMVNAAASTRLAAELLGL